MRCILPEHSNLNVGEQGFAAHHLNALAHWQNEQPSRQQLFSLGATTLKTRHFVGVLKVGEFTLEIVPKTDRGHSDAWQRILLPMLQAAGQLPLHISTSAHLAVVQGLLPLYLRLFLSEVEQLIHQGLIKQYRQEQGQTTTLRGRIHWPSQLRDNLVRKDRFTTVHTVYDKEHIWNALLHAALALYPRLSPDRTLNSQAQSYALSLPSTVPIPKVTEDTFQRLKYTRKTEPYRTAMEIARLLLLHYHPDVRQGQHDVLALLWDMNRLWEQFLRARLRQVLQPEWIVTRPTGKSYYQGQSLQPDILLRHRTTSEKVIMDAKWKRTQQPSAADLRQLYVYQRYFGASKGILAYPGSTNGIQLSAFKPDAYSDSGVTNMHAGMWTIAADDLPDLSGASLEILVKEIGVLSER